MGLHASEGADNLWQAFAAPLRSFVARRVPPGVDADDVVQEVFLRIHERLPGLRDSDRLDAWIFRIARNILADTFRVRRRQHAFADRLADDELRPVPDVERAAVAELTACLAPMIAQLPDPYREALELTIEVAILRALEHLTVKRAVERLRAVVDRDVTIDGIASDSPAIRDMVEMITRVADSDASVLITGRSGTGKELEAS